MGLNKQEIAAIKRFVEDVSKHSKYEHIETEINKPGIGLYLKIDGKYEDLPCLAVAGTADGHWRVLKKDLTRASYTPDQVL